MVDQNAGQTFNKSLFGGSVSCASPHFRQTVAFFAMVGFGRRVLVPGLLNPHELPGVAAGWGGVAVMGGGMEMDERLVIKRLELLRTEHRDLDSAIEALREQNSADQLQIARLKKRKLRLRDEIALLEDELIPDIIA